MKRILTAAVVLMTCSAAFSQAPAENTKTFSIGPAIGFGHTGIRSTAGTDVFKPNWNAGIILNYSHMKHTGLAADILWSMEGARVQSNGYETELSMQYIRVPLKFAYFFGDFEDNFRPKITIGPSLGFLLHASSDSDAPDSPKTDVTGSYNTFDIGGAASIGFNLKMGENLWLNTDFNYYTSFRPISGSQYNSNFGLRVGVAFGL